MEYLIFGVFMVVALFVAQIMSYMVLMNIVLTKKFMTNYQKKIQKVYENLGDDSEEQV